MKCLLEISYNGRIKLYSFPSTGFITSSSVRELISKDKPVPFLFSSINYSKISDQELIRLDHSFLDEIPSIHFPEIAIRLSQLANEQRDFIVEQGETKDNDDSDDDGNGDDITTNDEKAVPIMLILSVAAPIAQYAGNMILDYWNSREESTTATETAEDVVPIIPNEQNIYDYLSVPGFSEWNVEKLMSLFHCPKVFAKKARAADKRESQIWVRIFKDVASVSILYSNLMSAQRLQFVRANQYCYYFIASYNAKNIRNTPGCHSIFSCLYSVEAVLENNADLLNSLSIIADGVLEDFNDGERNPMKLAMGAAKDVFGMIGDNLSDGQSGMSNTPKAKDKKTIKQVKQGFEDIEFGQLRGMDMDISPLSPSSSSSQSSSTQKDKKKKKISKLASLAKVMK